MSECDWMLIAVGVVQLLVGLWLGWYLFAPRKVTEPRRD